MNALYLTYAVLTVAYFLLDMKWDTKWLQQGNYLFLALVATVMLFHDCMDFAVAYFGGYIKEMFQFYQEKIGNGYLIRWIGLIILPALGIINYVRRIRLSKRTQVVLWCLVTISLAITGYQQQSLDVYLPFFPIQTSLEPGFHTTMVSTELAVAEVLLTLLMGGVFTTLLGKFLKWKDACRGSQLKLSHNALNDTRK